MRSIVASLTVVALLAGVFSSLAYGQKGMGDPTGVARQAVKPAVVSLAGEVVAVKTQPCEKTTGRGQVGTHILLKTEKEELNVHLGWAEAVKDIADQLTVGKKVEVAAFRTDKMPEGHYVAKSLTFDGKTVELRDENLRPVWAGSGQRGSQQPAGRGHGWGRGRGRGW